MNKRYEDLTLLEVWYIFTKNIIFIVMGVILVGISVWFYTDNYITPVYSTYTTIVLGKHADYMEDNTTITSSEISLNQKLIGTYAEIAKSSLVVSKVKSNLMLDKSEKVIIENLSVTLLNNSEIIRISVKDKDPKIAASIANESAEVFMTEVSDLMQIKNVRVIDKAKVPTESISPNIVKNTSIACVLTFAILFLLLIVKELFDFRLKDSRYIEEKIHMRLLGIMPFQKSASKNNANKMVIQLIADPKSYFSESIRSVRTMLQFFTVDRPMKTIVITSPSSGEGKSTLSANLAVSLAQNSSKVILVDGDIRRSVMHKIFGINNLKGLSTLLLDINNYSLYINKSDIEGLDIITSGPLPPNPSELLHSNSMSQLLKKLENKYDYVIVDTAPVGLVTDGVVLSAKADGTILVCSINETDKRLLDQSRRRLKHINANVLGVILNKMPTKNSPYYRYYSNEPEKINQEWQLIK